MKQEYSNYTMEDFEVWRTLFERQMKILPNCASKSYLQALDTVGFRADKIPDFDEVNEILGRTSGWKLAVVPNIIPNEEFFPLLSKRTFSATTWLRKMSQLDYLEEPDMFHDVFGHVPLLSNPTFCAFFKGLAEIGMRYLENKEAIEMLGRMYWFTIEFGLIRENDELRIYGAGILSSHGETKYSLSNEPEHVEFSVSAILEQEYDNMKIQDKYFIVQDFEQLFNSLEEIEKYIEQRIENGCKTVWA
jgi:phenylalanine-4-hydroxylase